MKIKNIDLINFVNMLQNYMDKKLPQKIGYAIARNFAVLSEEYKFYSTQYEKLINDFADKIKKDADGNFTYDRTGLPIIENPEDARDFVHPMEELLNIEIDVEFFYIDESVFDYEDSERYDPLSPADIYNLKKLLCKSEKE